MSRETKKPEQLRANTLPTDGYVMSVDGKLKARFDTAEDAMAAATKLKQSYPVIQAAVYDAAARTYTQVSAPNEPVVSPEEDANKADA